MAALIHDLSFRTRFQRFDGHIPEQALACVQFGLGLKPGGDPRHVTVGLRPLQGVDSELWLSDRPVQRGRTEGFDYAHNGGVLFGSLRLPESELQDLERATLKAYVRIEWLLQHLGYPCWLRMWNFFGGINQGAGDRERYRLFSAGRYRALALKPAFEAGLPAATAIGMLEPGMVIYFLAGKQPGAQVENPRQVSAFHYPRQYGPRSPSFSRATLLHHPEAARLLVSGTASVVGHETLHAGDALAQLREAAANVEALLQKAGAAHGLAPGRARAEPLKIYLRDPDLIGPLAPEAARLFGADTPLLFLQADICRSDLLLELEGTYTLPGTKIP